MEIIDKEPEYIIPKELVEKITKKINQSIIDEIENSYEYRNTENRKRYENKFQIIVAGNNNIIPYKVHHFIHKQIEKEIDQGYIEREENDELNNKKWSYKISLNNIHMVTYIYNPDLSDNTVIRMHQTEYDYELSQNTLRPTFIKYGIDLTTTETNNGEFYL